MLNPANQTKEQYFPIRSKSGTYESRSSPRQKSPIQSEAKFMQRKSGKLVINDLTPGSNRRGEKRRESTFGKYLQ